MAVMGEYKEDVGYMCTQSDEENIDMIRKHQKSIRHYMSKLSDEPPMKPTSKRLNDCILLGQLIVIVTRRFPR